MPAPARAVYLVQGARGAILRGDPRLDDRMTGPQALAALEGLARAGVACSLRIDLESLDLADAAGEADQWELG